MSGFSERNDKALNEATERWFEERRRLSSIYGRKFTSQGVLKQKVSVRIPINKDSLAEGFINVDGEVEGFAESISRVFVRTLFDDKIIEIPLSDIRMTEAEELE
jgi:hypothetical protein